MSLDGSLPLQESISDMYVNTMPDASNSNRQYLNVTVETPFQPISKEHLATDATHQNLPTSNAATIEQERKQISVRDLVRKFNQPL